jgi:predicted dithiol-disulfide oxidoreductase (DUF899 family)
MSHLNYPNESAEHREARNRLLAEEIALRTQIEAVAERRRALPPGGEVPQDYLFERIGKNLMPEKVEMSKLFGRNNTLILYSFMASCIVVLPSTLHTMDGWKFRSTNILRGFKSIWRVFMESAS